MNSTDRTRLELLNAYLDGELPDWQARHFRQRLAAEPDLRRQLRDTEQVRALTRAAWQMELANTPMAPRIAAWRKTAYAMAAVLLVALGMGVEHWRRPASGGDELLIALPATAQVIRPYRPGGTGASTEQRTLFHVSSANPQTLQATLEQLQTLLQQHQRSGKPLRVEIVANAEGLNLLRADTSTARDQIARLHREHPNLAFVACGTTLARLKHERGLEVKLLPQVQVASSALDQILQRLDQGWTYIRL